MNGFLIRKQDDSQIPTIHFIDLGPAANSTVLLYHFANRMFDCLENPLFPDYGSIRSRAHRQEVGAEFHWHDFAKGYHPLQPNPANVATLGLITGRQESARRQSLPGNGGGIGRNER